MIAHFAVKYPQVIPLQFIGRQIYGDIDLELFNVKAPFPNPMEGFEHPINSTLSRKTIEGLGWEIR